MGQILQSYHYTMAKTGHRTQIDEHDGTVRAYDYDDLWRLTQDKVTNTEGLVYQEDFQYDPVGNRLLANLQESGGPPLIQGYSYDSRDRLVQHNGQRVDWDRGGRIKEQPEIWPAPGRSYRWWSDDHLLEVETTDGVKVETAYDVNGNRVESTETVGGQSDTTGYLVDDSGWLSHVVADFDGADTEAVYVRAGDQLLGLSRDGPENRHYHLDGLGCVRALSDASGGMVEGLDYSAFGRSLGTLSQAYGFTGEPRIAVGLGYHRARWLDPGLGRFASVDPFPAVQGLSQSLNRYVYSMLSPVSLSDPSGLFSGGLSETLAVNGIRSALASIQGGIGGNLILGAENRGKLSARDLLIANLLPVLLAFLAVTSTLALLGFARFIGRALRTGNPASVIRALTRLSARVSRIGRRIDDPNARQAIRTASQTCTADCKYLSELVLPNLPDADTVVFLQARKGHLPTAKGVVTSGEGFNFHAAVLMKDGTVLDPLLNRMFDSLADFKEVITGGAENVDLIVRGMVR